MAHFSMYRKSGGGNDVSANILKGAISSIENEDLLSRALRKVDSHGYTPPFVAAVYDNDTYLRILVGGMVVHAWK